MRSKLFVRAAALLTEYGTGVPSRKLAVVGICSSYTSEYALASGTLVNTPVVGVTRSSNASSGRPTGRGRRIGDAGRSRRARVIRRRKRLDAGMVCVPGELSGFATKIISDEITVVAFMRTVLYGWNG